jgi:peptidyl-prolyl cis-trans isomerase SurA
MTPFFWGLLHLNLSFCSVMIFSGLGLAQETIVVDRIVAAVNDKLITLYDLNQAFEPYAKNIKALGYAADKERKMLLKVRSDLLNQLIDSKLADQEIEKHKLKITKNEIDNAIEQIKAVRSYTDEDLLAGLAQQGLTMEDFRKELKEQLLRRKLVTLEVQSKIVITNDSLQAYYDSHPEKYAGEKKYHLWNIFVNTSSYAKDSEKRSALKRMEAILVKLRQGQNFESLANDDFLASVQAKGGDLGLFLLKELSPQLQKVVGDMEAGESSSILDTEYGYQIIYVQKIIEAPAKSLSEVENEIRDILYKELVDNKYQEWLEDLRKRSHIKIIN